MIRPREEVKQEGREMVLEGRRGEKREEASNARVRVTESMDIKGLVLMLLLALQYGLQPILTRNLVSSDITITTQVMACEIIKVVLSTFAFVFGGSARTSLHTWRPRDAIISAGVPACVFALQNFLIQVSYRNLDNLSFTLLNQTKLPFTALFNFLFLGFRQTRQQIVALILMLISAILLSLAQASPSSSSLQPSSLFLGVLPVIIASVTSGIGSTFCQWTMQVKGRNPHLFTMEMCSLSALILLLTTLFSSDGSKIRSLGFLYGWTTLSLVPVLTNAVGGILVGLVTKAVGGVRKGFMVIAALLITAIARFAIDGSPPSPLVWVAMPLVVIGTYIHSSYPYLQKIDKKKD